MANELRRLQLSTETDVLLVHDLAMLLTRLAGLSPSSQVRFAAQLTQGCFDLPPDDYIIFGMDEREGKPYLLHAASQSGLLTIAVETPKKIDHIDLAILDETTRKSRRQLEENYRDMQQFTFALSHELKNALARLKMAVALAAEEDMAPALRNYIQVIQRSTGKLEYTMQSLNEVIKLGHTSPGVVKRISPAALFEEVRSEFTESLYNMNATVSVNMSAVKEIKYIEPWLRTIFSNMLSNAIKYASPLRALYFTVTAKKQGQEIVFTFTDNGIGINLASARHRLFMPFTRFSDHTEGTGIGLYLVKSMVERNGGRMEVKSEVDKGTEFTCYLMEY
jgi:signal transduction histidine kinase